MITAREEAELTPHDIGQGRQSKSLWAMDQEGTGTDLGRRKQN